MAESEGVVMYAAAYGSLEDAEMDFEGIKILKAEKFLGDYEAALFTKEEGGKVKIVNTDATERGWGAKVGLVTGAVIGLIFPPSILGMGALGAGVGAVLGNFMKGMKRSDIEEVGNMLDEGQAGIILVGEVTIEEGMDRLMKRAAKVAKKEVDAQAKEIKDAIDEAAK
jgi:uncharacterized membrane protein